MAELRVCHVINSLTHGGAENLLVYLAEAMDDVEFTVVYFGGDADLAHKLDDAGVTVRRLGERFRFDPGAAVRLSRILGSTGFDIVHAHLPYAQTISRLASQVAGETPVVSTQHNFPSNYHPVVRLTERITRGLDDATVAVSKGVERAFTGRAHSAGDFADRWCTIYNGIDVQGFRRRVDEADGEAVRTDLGIRPDSQLLLSIGRYVPDKKQATLIKGFSRASLGDTELVIVGHGPLESELRRTATRLDVAERTHVTGRVPKVEPYYAAADAFVSASRVEGLPVTVLEAMAAELPVVASDIPGTNEVVVPGETGLLFSQGSVDELSKALSQVEPPMRRRQLGENGYERAAETFDVETMAATYLELYNSLMQKE
jgi:glycosyltransferase involved in cell wall biosynthesis